ncbi:MAG: hypothetical protein ACFB6S_08275 [Geminicoccaceae bacterium]
MEASPNAGMTASDLIWRERSGDPLIERRASIGTRWLTPSVVGLGVAAGAAAVLTMAGYGTVRFAHGWPV